MCCISLALHGPKYAIISAQNVPVKACIKTKVNTIIARYIEDVVNTLIQFVGLPLIATYCLLLRMIKVLESNYIIVFLISLIHYVAAKIPY